MGKQALVGLQQRSVAASAGCCLGGTRWFRRLAGCVALKELAAEGSRKSEESKLGAWRSSRVCASAGNGGADAVELQKNREGNRTRRGGQPPRALCVGTEEEGSEAETICFLRLLARIRSPFTFAQFCTLVRLILQLELKFGSLKVRQTRVPLVLG